MIRSVLFACLGVLHVACGGDGDRRNLEVVVEAQVMDSLLASRFAPGGPGAAMMILGGGSVIYEAAIGMADLETGRPLAVETPFYIASLAKPITAGAVENLINRDRLRLTDTLGSLFPELRSYSGVSVSQLLSHTSGIPDYFDYVSFRDLRMLDNNAVIDTLEQHGLDLQSRVKGYFYSNSNYVLLAEIVGKIAGQSFATVLEEQFFDPLGLETAFLDDADEPYGAAARAYMPVGDGFRVSEYEFVELPGGITGQFDFRTTGAGGLYMSAADLASWVAHWQGRPQTERQLSVAELDLAEVDSLTAANGIGMVLGYSNAWFYSRLLGHTVVWHDGNRGGFNACLAAVPEYDVVIVVLVNRGDVRTTPIVEAALSLILAQVGRP